jgi:ribosomal protein L37E
MTDERETGACGRCGETIPTDVDRCPLCGYHPGPRNRRATRLAEYALVAVAVASVGVFLGGVAASALDLPVGDLTRVAIVTPYTAGVSGFFAYYLHRKRRATPTDDETVG